MDEVVTMTLGVLITLLGRGAIKLATFGHWRTESLDEPESRIYAAAGALSFVRDGRRIVTPSGQFVAGVLVLIVLIGGAIAYWVAA